MPSTPLPSPWPLPPSNLLNVTNHHNPDGNYIFGYTDFIVPPRHVTSIFRRSIAGSHEDFILGILCVVMIALLTEIFQVILMRTRSRQVNPGRVYAAVFLDELTHFRNVVRFIRRPSATRSPASNGLLYSSLTILIIAVILLSAEVFAVYLTQPVKIYASSSRYNIKGIQPAATTPHYANLVHQAFVKKPCITPMMPASNLTREYSIVACVNRLSPTNTAPETSRFFSFSSWYHKAGSDHLIQWQPSTDPTSKTSNHQLTIRATLMQSEKSHAHAIRFETNSPKAAASYLHHYAMFKALEWACDQKDHAACELIRTKSLPAVTTRTVTRTIEYWDIKNEPVTSIETGFVTEFSLTGAGLSDARSATEHVLGVFATSAVIQETEGEGMYVNMRDGNSESRVEHLVSEHARIAGIALITLVLFILMTMLILLRICLKPVSLAELARDRVDEEHATYLHDDGDFVGAGPTDNREWESLERDIAGPTLEDYESPVMFDPPDFSRPRPGSWVFDENSGQIIFR